MVISKRREHTPAMSIMVLRYSDVYIFPSTRIHTHGGKRPEIHCGVPCGVSFHHMVHNLHVTREQLVRKTFIFNEHCTVTISSKKY